MNSKGISPVIATVLLVLVAVAITMVVATFVTSITGEKASEAEEQARGLGGSFLIKSCTRSGATVTLVLENTGKKDLNNFTVYCLDATGGSEETATISVDVLSPGESSTKTAACKTTTRRVRVVSAEYNQVKQERDCTAS